MCARVTPVNQDNPVRITAPFLDVLEAFLDAGGGGLHG